MAASTLITNLTQEWQESLLRLHLSYFLILNTVITVAALLTNTALLACIFLSRALRQETRYLLVANTLLADMLYLLLNLARAIFNVTRGVQMPGLVCELITAAIVTVCSCATFTITLMVVDTYAALRWPLRYQNIVSPGRTRCMLLAVWGLAALYPLSLMIIAEVKGGIPRETVPVCLVVISLGFLQIKDIGGIMAHIFVTTVFCVVVISFCYIRLYMVTRTQGIWRSRFSKAWVTVLVHGVLLLLYFIPTFVLIVELFLFQMKDISLDLRVWISTVNTCVFILLPRALAPYLYGLRYREIADSLMQRLHLQRTLIQVTV